MAKVDVDQLCRIIAAGEMLSVLAFIVPVTTKVLAAVRKWSIYPHLYMMARKFALLQVSSLPWYSIGRYRS
ncbi:MAG TPA: hypothetical protein GXX40_02955 [Firmicutes bacterium]|nr:hypothetical protein [Bacillota bacterium]